MAETVVICAAARTPIGNFSGALASVPPATLGATVIRALLQRSGVDAALVDEVVLGCVLTAGLGQNVARQASVAAGIPVSVPAYTINKVCGSGLKAVILAAQAIACGDADIVAAGGMESMSGAAHVLSQARSGYRLGHGQLVDTLLQDALTDAFQGCHMGITAETLATRYTLSREDQDACALASQQKAAAAIRNGAFAEEICTVRIIEKSGERLITEDEYPRPGISAETLAKLRPAFAKDGTVTAGNASGINDGAAALLLVSEKKARALGLTPLARIAGYASAGVEPDVMGLGPVPAVRKALRKAGWTMEDLDYIEANEAFAAQYLAVERDLDFDPERVNIHGGAIALGHPVGASGARILTTLVHILKNKQARRGLATLCVGGGQGVCVLLERGL